MGGNTHVYIGTLPCGCRVAATVDLIDRPQDTACAVSEMVRDGCAVSRHALTDLQGGAVTLDRCFHWQLSAR